MPGLTVALVAAVAWAGLDFTRKKLVEDSAPLSAAALLTLLMGPLFALWGVLARSPLPGTAYAGPGVAIVAIQSLANVLFFRALAVSPLSATIPFLSLTPVFASLLALGLLGERPTALQGVGVLLVTVGAFLVNWRPGVSPLLALRREPGSLLAIGVAALWSLASPLDKVALAHAALPWHAAVQTGGVGLLLSMVALLRGGPRALWVPVRSRRWLLLSVVFAAAALSLQLAALRLALVGVVESLKRAVGIGSSALLGQAALGERVGAARWGAIGLMGLGSVLLALGGHG